MSGELSRLKPPAGANRERKHKGRGIASGNGKTAGRGMKGQAARKSGQVRPGFEGGQMPMQRRLPKRGFKNIHGKEFAEVRVLHLNRFEDGAVVDVAALKEAGLAKKLADGIKVIGNAAVERKLTVRVHRISKGAREQIEAKGGTVELIPDRKKFVRPDSRKARRDAKLGRVSA
ncbi:MAG: 50S ribosomal protein L15 [Deltaproteobacteria bacterium]|nr:50S ribosomal protein L15 [Deltaproteobacteria bacterium]